MKRFHANVGARNTALEKAPEVLNPISMNLAIYVLLRMVDDFMCVLILQRFVGIVFVAVKKRVKSDVFVNVFSQGRGLTIGDDLGAYMSSAFNHSKHDGLGTDSAPRTCEAARLNVLVHVPSFPADEGLVHFDFAPELGTKEVILQSEPDAMKHEPCSLLGNFQIASNLVATDAVLAVGQHPSCCHPLIKADGRIFIDSTDLNGELPLRMVSAALPHAAFRVELNLVRSARRADNALGPAAYRKVVNAVVQVGKVKERFLEAFRFAAHNVLHEPRLA